MLTGERGVQEGCWPCREASEHVTGLRHISVLGAAGGWPAHLRTPNLRYLDLLHSPLQDLPRGPLPHLHFLRLRGVDDVQVSFPSPAAKALRVQYKRGTCFDD
jgi:hypothetical protein